MFTTFTVSDFRDRFGLELSKRISGGDDKSKQVDRAINLVTEKIQEYILSRMPFIDFDEISSTVNTYINRASMEQLKYELEEADYSGMSGYNAFTGQMIPISEIKAREICSKAKTILANHVISAGFY